MADEVKVTGIKFDACKPRKSLVGFVDFVYNGKFNFTDVGVHKKLDNSGYRLVYAPTSYPIDHHTQRAIDKIISDYIKEEKVNNEANFDSSF